MNYKAWDIEVDDFYNLKTPQEKLRHLIGFAVLAPSSHNSQPWKFVLDGNKIKVFADFSRALAVSDKDNRQLYISIGCAIENLITATEYYGLRFKINYFPNDNKELVAEIEFENLGDQDHSSQKEEHKIHHINKRSVNRNKYERENIDENFINEIKRYSNNDILVSIITDKDKIDEISEIMRKAIRTALADKEFRKELSQYVKHNKTKEYYGMPGFGFGMPLPISLIFPKAVKHIDVSRVNSKQDSDLIKNHTPAICIIGTKGNNELLWVKAGEVYEKIALDAQKSGIKTAVMAAATQIGDFHKDLQKVLENDFRPQVFFRMGYSDKTTPHSPRFLTEDVIKKI